MCIYTKYAHTYIYTKRTYIYIYMRTCVKKKTRVRVFSTSTNSSTFSFCADICDKTWMCQGEFKQ